jgi:hypothetical protein
MPHPQQRQQFSRPRLSRLRRLWRGRSPALDSAPRAATSVARHDAPATLVDAEPGTAIIRRGNRVAELIAAHDSGREITVPQRPRANPAFAEALFVELMRAHQYRRAFDLLSSDCRRAWGSADAFAAAQAQGSMSRLRGMRVKAVRHLAEWTDHERDMSHHEVAELDVEYVIGSGEPAVINRVVHLVADSGKWRLLCYPHGTVR